MHHTRPRRVTLREVAQRAGVSPTTASFVLAGRDDLPHLEMGRRAVRTLLAADRTATVDLVPMPVRERASIAAPRPADGVAERELG